MKPKSALRSFLAIAGSSLLAVSYSHAATRIWDGDLGTAGTQDATGTFTWASGDLKFGSSPGNVATTNDITTDIAQFGNGGTISTSAAIINVSTQSINGLIFGTTATNGYTLTASTSGQALTIGGSGILMNSGAQPISVGSANLGITLGAAQSWTNNDNSTLTIGGAVTNGGYMLTVGGTGATTINGAIGGVGGLTKSGAGTLTLSNSSNGYSGGTFISGGIISVTASTPNGALGGSGSNVTFDGTSTLLHNVNNATGFILGTVTINGAGTVATITKNAGVFNGNLTHTITTLTGSGTLVAGDNFAGIYDIANASTFTGNIRMQTGSSSSGVTVKIRSLADTAGSSVQFTGASNATTTHTLTLNGNSGPLTFNNRQIQITGAGITGQAYTPTLQNDNSSTNIWVINTDLLNSAGATAGARRLGLAGGNTGNNAFNGVISNGVAGGTIGVTKSGGGTWNVTNTSNSYSGGTTVSGGTLGFASGALGSSGTINASGGTLLWLASNTQDISSRLAMTAATASTFHTNGNDVSFASAVGSATTGQLVKTGIGTLTLGGTNTYTGFTTLNAGKLKLDYGASDTSKLSNTAVIGILNLNGGTLELSGGTHLETVLSTTLNTGGTFITQPTGGATLSMGGITFTGGAIDFAEDSIATTTTGVTNGILSQRATVAGAHFAMKSGSNIVAYDYVTSGGTGYTGGAMAANTNYAMQTAGGANTLNAGTIGATSNTLKIANTATGSLAVGANTLTVGAILFTGSADYDITTSGAGKITPSILHNYGTGGAVLNLGALGGSLTQFGTGGKTILNNAATTNSTLNINGGTVQISANDQIGTNSGVVAITLNNGTLLASADIALNNAGANHRTVTLGAGGGTLAAASAKTLTVSGVISGALNPLTVGSSGNTGTVTLSAVNTYSGATNVDAGTLNVASTGTINSTSAINVAAGGTLRYNSSTALTVAPTLAGNTSSNRAVLGGTGTIDASITLDNLGDVLSPGNSPGIQTYNANQTWASLTYVWELNDWTDIVAGTDFDQIAITGTLDLSGSAYGFDIVSLNSLNAAGLVGAGGGNLFAETDRSWTILTTTGGITNFDGLEWNINAAGFANSESGSWSIAQSGNNLVLSYASVPEPHAALLGGLGMLMLLRRRRA